MDVGSPILGGAAIPGDPDGLRAIAARLQTARDDVSSVQGRVASNGLGDWSGSAGDAFRSSLNKLPGELGSVAGAFDEAAGAINSFSGQLTGFQERAAYYANRIKTLEQELAATQHRHDEAQSRVQAARLRESAAHDPVSLKTAVDAVRYGLSLLHQALDDLDLHSQEITRVQHEAQVNREDYENAVRACCAQLQGASDSCTHSNGSSHISVSSIVGGIGLFWARYLKRPEEDAEWVYGRLDALGKLVENGVPVSRLGRWAVPIVRMEENPIFKGMGRLFIPFAVYGTFQALRTTLDETRGENILGRAYTSVATAGGEGALMLWWPAGVANLTDGGALSADVHGVALIGGGELSGGMSGGRNAYQQDVRDRESGNYLGLTEHVVGGAVSGGVRGALAGDEQFANNAASGRYGGVVKDMAKGEDFAIEHPKAALEAAVHAPVSAVKDLYHGGVHLLDAL